MFEAEAAYGALTSTPPPRRCNGSRSRPKFCSSNAEPFWRYLERARRADCGGFPFSSIVRLALGTPGPFSTRGSSSALLSLG